MKPLSCIFGIKQGVKLAEVRHIVEPRVHEMVIKAMDGYVDAGVWAVQGDSINFNITVNFGDADGPIITERKSRLIWHWPKKSDRGIFVTKEK